MHMPPRKEESLFADEDAPSQVNRVSVLGADAPLSGQTQTEAALDPRAVRVGMLAVICVVVFILCQFSPFGIFSLTFSDGLRIGSVTLAEVLSDIGTQASKIFAFLSLQSSAYAPQLFLYLMIALSGAGLSLSGAVYQGSLKNALASPSTLGVMSGAMLGTVLFWAFSSNEMANPMFFGTVIDNSNAGFWGLLWFNWGASICAFLVAILIACVVLLISMLSAKTRSSKIYLIIAGLVLGTVVTGVVGVIRSYFTRTDPGSDRTLLIVKAQSATFGNGYDLISVLSLGLPLLLIIVFVMLNHRKLTLLSFDDREASSMGIATGKLRIVAILACTSLTAIIVSFCGPIGFLGFFIPHMMRKLVGPDFKYLIPAVLFAGATFCVAAYTVSNLFVGGAEMTGMFISLVGGFIFLAVAFQQRGGRHGDWL